MKDDHTLVIVSDDCGDVTAQLMLNNDQIRFLEWLIDREWLNQDNKNFQVMDEENTPIII